MATHQNPKPQKCHHSIPPSTVVWRVSASYVVKLGRDRVSATTTTTPSQEPRRRHSDSTPTHKTASWSRCQNRVNQQRTTTTQTPRYVCVTVSSCGVCGVGLCAAPPCSIGTPQLLDAALCRQHLTKGGHSVASGCLLADSQRRDRCTSINRQKVTCDCVCGDMSEHCAGMVRRRDTHHTHAPAHDNTPATAQTGPCKPLGATPSSTPPHTPLPPSNSHHSNSSATTTLSACVPPLNDRNHQGHLLLLPAAAGPGKQ